MSDREIIYNYLKSLTKYLSRLDEEDADEVIREIESHIYDALDEGYPTGKVQEILDGFGSPRQLAAAYVEHILDGAPPPVGFRAIHIVKTGVSRGLYYSVGAAGFSLSICALFLGVVKLLAPHTIGIWVAEHGQAVVIGTLQMAPAGTKDILGWWFAPLAFILCGSATIFTRRLLHALKKKK